MNRLLLAFSGLVVISGCGAPEVIVTRDQFGDDWPLSVNSAVVVCEEQGTAPVLKVGVKRYALNAAARARGYPDVSEIVETTADPERLGSVCTPQVASNS